MNKILMVLLSLSQISFATSMRSTLLRVELSPLYGQGKITSVDVYHDGAVIGRTCDSELSGDRRTLGFRKCSSKNLATLNESALLRIKKTVERARKGEIVQPDPSAIHCLAVPNQQFLYTADNFSVALKEGTRPCGLVSYNDTISAETLVKMLDGYLVQYQKLVADRN